MALALFLIWPLAGQGAVVAGLYEAEVAVADQGSASQKQGVASALQEVLIKLTGDRAIQDRSDISELLQRPDQFVQHYKFQKKPVIRNDQLVLDGQLYLQVAFNADLLDKAMQNYGIPQWGRIRPATLIWLVAQQDSGKSFVGLEDTMGYAAVIGARAQQRGIPLIYPVLDYDDRLIIQEEDIGADSLDPIRQASQRYAPDAVLTGTIMAQETGNWDAQWMMLVHEETVALTTTGESAELALQAGIDWLADELARRYVQPTAVAGSSGVDIVVQNINNFNEYSRVLKYLRTLNSVTGVEVKSAEPGSVTYTVTTTGGELAVVRAIELGKLLESLNVSGSPYRMVQ